MGGFGSGRTSGGGRATVEMCRSIEINRLHKAGVLGAGWSGGWKWTRDGEKVASIGMRGGRELIELVYRWKQSGADWQDVVEPIRVRWRPCRFGGERPFFECPGAVRGVACHRAVAKLYSAGRYYLCRHCYRLTYASRREDGCDRALRRANKIRVRLGGEPGSEAVLPERPQSMRHATYQRLLDQVVEGERRAEERLEQVTARFLKLDPRADAGKSKRKKGFWR